MNWEVILDKPMKIKEPDIWGGGWTYTKHPRTVAIIAAATEQRLIQKLNHLYPGVKVMGYKRI